MKSHFLFAFILFSLILPLDAFALRVSASPSSATLNEDGGSQVFSVILDEPVIAEEGEAYVTINLTTDDDRLELSVPSVTFHADDWFTPQSFTVNVVNDRIHNTNNVTHITMLADSNSEYYSNFQNTITVTLVDDDPVRSSRSGSVHYSCRDPLATNYESLGAPKQSLCIYNIATPQTNNAVVTTPTFADLSFGMSSESVLKLQEFLIKQAIGIEAKKLIDNGATGYFGPLTKNALIEYQTKFNITPATGRFGPLTRAQIKSSGAQGLWW